MSDEIQKTALRLPKALHEAIHKAAKESGRTMNAEIVYRLEQSFPAGSIVTKAVTDSDIRDLYFTIMLMERSIEKLEQKLHEAEMADDERESRILRAQIMYSKNSLADESKRLDEYISEFQKIKT